MGPHCESMQGATFWWRSKELENRPNSHLPNRPKILTTRLKSGSVRPSCGYYALLPHCSLLFPTRSEQLLVDLSNAIWLHLRSAQALVVVCVPEAAVLSSFCRRLEVPRRNTAGDIAAGSSRALGHTPFSLGHSRRADGMGAGCGRRWPAVPQACYWVATPAVARA